MDESWGRQLHEVHFYSHPFTGLCKVLPSIHTLTGCNYTSIVGSKLAALTTNPETHLGEFDSMINGLGKSYIKQRPI